MSVAGYLRLYTPQLRKVLQIPEPEMGELGILPVMGLGKLAGRCQYRDKWPSEGRVEGKEEYSESGVTEGGASS